MSGNYHISVIVVAICVRRVYDYDAICSKGNNKGLGCRVCDNSRKFTTVII